MNTPFTTARTTATAMPVPRAGFPALSSVYASPIAPYAPSTISAHFRPAYPQRAGVGQRLDLASRSASQATSQRVAHRPVSDTARHLREN